MDRDETTSTGGVAEIRGHSDDTFGIYGAGTDIDHDDCASFSVREIVIRQPDGAGLIVRGKYGDFDGGWQISVVALDDEKHFARDMRLVQDGYSMVLHIMLVAGDHISLSQIKGTGR